MVKHALARSASVSAQLVDREVRIEVRDDGCGFDPDSPGAGRGLLGMRERVELLGGKIEVESEPEAGTCISARLPVQRI